MTDDEDIPNIPQDILTLPVTSRNRYEKAYKLFCDWREIKHIKRINEDVMLAYFYEKSKIWKASSLWSVYSMLKSTLQINENVNIAQYIKLISFLKRQNDTYEAKKSEILSMKNVQQFLKEAPDEDYLLMKVVLIFGLNGACRKGELCNLKVNDIEDTGLILIVTLNGTKTKKTRRFTVTSESNGYELYKRYACLRPINVTHRRFFLFYKKGKCTVQPVGINTFAKMPKRVAEFLNLPNASNYTGHCLRRTSATFLSNSVANMHMLNRHGGLRSDTVAEEYVEDSIENKVSKITELPEIKKEKDQTSDAEETALYCQKLSSHTYTQKDEIHVKEELMEFTDQHTSSISIDNNLESAKDNLSRNFSLNDIQRVIDLCKQAELHIVEKDPSIVRSRKFRRELQRCLLPYQELLAELQSDNSSISTNNLTRRNNGNITSAKNFQIRTKEKRIRLTVILDDSEDEDK